MNQGVHTAIIVSFLFISLISCSNKTSTPGPSILAMVGPDVLTEQMVLTQYPDNWQATVDSTLLIEKIQTSWVRDQLLLRHAEQLRVQSNKEYQTELENLKRELLIKSVTEQILSRNPKQFDVSLEEASEFFQQNKESLSLDEDFVRIRPFSSSSKRDAESAREALFRGGDWEQIVSRFSYKRDEQLEYANLFIPISQAFIEVPPLHRMLPNLGITEVSEIVSYQGAYHFVQVLEVIPKGESGNLDWTISQIQLWLREEKKRKYLNSYIRNLYLQAESNNDIYIRDVSTL